MCVDIYTKQIVAMQPLLMATYCQHFTNHFKEAKKLS